MSKTIFTEPLTVEAFAPFGDVLDAVGDPNFIINQGKCGRFHDLAKLDFETARAGISLFKAELRQLPYELDMMERHPLGSQAFVPMSEDGFLITVAEDDHGAPALPRAFVSSPGQAINFHRGTWHGVLTPLGGSGLFAVIDRIGDGHNLEEVWFDEPYLVNKQR